MKRAVTYLVILALTFLTIAAVLIATGHAETTKARPNTLGVLETYSNPNTYLLAMPIEGKNLEGAYSVRFWPFATPALYDESVLFCDIGDKFDGKHGVLILTYETRAHRMYKGVACHELVAVFEVKVPKEVQ